MGEVPADAPPADERAIGEPVTEDTVNPDGFDLGAWIAGVRPVQRTASLNIGGWMLAKLDALEARIDAAPENENVDDLIDEFDRVRGLCEAGAVEFKIEAWTRDHVLKFQEDTARELGVSVKDPDGVALIGLYQCAAQTVSPKITAQDLLGMSVVGGVENELSEFIAKVLAANNETVRTARVMTRDFSRRRSVPAPD